MSTDRQASPLEVARALEGIDFPTTKQKLIDHARENDHSDRTKAVVTVLDQLSDRRYESMAEVEKGVGQVE